MIHAALYGLIGAISFATADVASNTAAVWVPTGYALALLLAHGPRLWPAVALGAFILNCGDNLVFAAVPAPASVAVALAVAAGNTGEALLAAWLARRCAGGVTLLARPVHIAAFAALVAPLPPLVSMGVGVAASYLGGVVPAAAVPEAMLTWYLANAVGILIATAPFLALFAGARRSLPRGRWTEAIVLTVCLVFVTQAMDGVAIAPAFRDWPRTYMLIPLLLWAAFRFRTAGALAAITLAAAVSILGTMRGFEAFPATSYSRSLLYLQLFLGLLAVTTLAITASLAEIDALQAETEALVRDRTAEVERLVHERDLYSTLVVHDLQSPLFGVRNALRAAATAIEGGSLPPREMVAALRAMDDSCCDLAARVGGLLRPHADADIVQEEALSALVARIAAARGLNGVALGRLILRLEAANLVVRRPV